MKKDVIRFCYEPLSEWVDGAKNDISYGYLSTKMNDHSFIAMQKRRAYHENDACFQDPFS
jgi:hypothetical protein